MATAKLFRNGRSQAVRLPKELLLLVAASRRANPRWIQVAGFGVVLGG